MLEKAGKQRENKENIKADLGKTRIIFRMRKEKS